MPVKITKNRLPVIHGFWKFNNSLLDNEEFVTRLNFIHAKEKHRDTKGKRSYWEMIKLEIREGLLHSFF